jgi:hypothetical protein
MPPNDPFRQFHAAPGPKVPDAKPDPQRVVDGAPATASGLDADMADVVARFEELYAELTLPASTAATPPASTQADDPSFDLPDDFLNPGGAAGAPAAAKPKQEPYLDRLAARRPQPFEAKRAEPEKAPSIDEAMAILRSAETRTPPANERTINANIDAHAPSQVSPVRAAFMPLPRDTANRSTPLRYAEDERLQSPSTPLRHGRTEPVDRAVAPEKAPVAANESWSSRASSVWPKVGGAAVFALIVGAGVGFFFGKQPQMAPASAKIQTTAQGGAQLKIDQQLRQR